jgi:hypothetical protein
MNASEVLSLRLANHQLAGTDIKEPHKLVSWMGAMQAQDYSMAKWGIGARVPDITDGELDKAMDRGDIVRLHILRPTWHFVSKEDIYWMLHLSAPRLRAALRSTDKELELTEDLIAKTNSIIERGLEGRSLTRQELNAIINEAGIASDNRRINHIMYHAELNGVACNGALQGKKQTYALLQEKVPKTTAAFDKDECLYKLAYKYFRSHGPATLQDFVWWSGLTTGEARQALELIKDHFTVEPIGEQRYIFHKESIPVKKPDLINLLPAFDEFIISYRDRKETLHPEHQKKIISSLGIFRPAIAKNGTIIGSWKKSSSKKGAAVNPEYFNPVDKSIEDMVKEASERFKSFSIRK